VRGTTNENHGESGAGGRPQSSINQGRRNGKKEREENGVGEATMPEGVLVGLPSSGSKVAQS